MSDFTREVRFDPGHAIRRTKNDGSDYGIASMTIRFYLSGEHGTTQFVMRTGWYPEKVSAWRWRSSDPSAVDLGAHWDTPWSDYMTGPDGDYARMDCKIRPSGHCWYDGSGGRAEHVLEQFLIHGEDPVWALLEDEYRRIDADAAAIGANA